MIVIKFLESNLDSSSVPTLGGWFTSIRQVRLGDNGVSRD